MIIILEVVEGPATGRSITIDSGQTCLIGRVSGDLVLENDPLISGQHFSVTNDGQNCIVKDLESRNHVFVDGKQVPPLMPFPVVNQSRITAGKTTVFSVNLSSDTRVLETIDPATPLSNENPSNEIINESPAKKAKASNFGFDIDRLDAGEQESIQRDTNFPSPSSPKKEFATPGEEKTSPFDFSDRDPPISHSKSGSDPDPVSDNESESFLLDDSPSDQKTSIVDPPEKPTSNFSESIYIPGQKTSQHVTDTPQPSSSPTDKQDPIEFERIISEDGVYVFGGIGDVGDAANAVTELLVRLKNLGSIVCLTHATEDDSEEPTAESIDEEDEVDLTNDDVASENSAAPTGESDLTPTSAMPLFYWLPENVSRSAGPVMIALDDLPDFGEINAGQWGANSVMWLLGEDVKKITDQFKSVIRMDLKTGKQADGVLGICWPVILSSILDGKEASAISRIFGENLTAILFEDPETKYLWRFASTVDWSQRMQDFSIIEKN